MPRNRRKKRQKSRKSRNDPLARERMFEVIQLMRSKGYSLTHAAREALPVAAMTEGGIHLFRRATVEALARRRAKRKQQAERAVGGGRGDAP